MNRTYPDNGYASVTEALDVLRKIGLEMWFKFNSLEFIKAESEKGKAIGGVLHDVVASHIEKTEIEFVTEYPDEVKTALKSFMLFKKEHPEVKLKKAEISLTSEKYKYNGTLDCLGKIKEEIIFDWKTSKCKKKSTPVIYEDYIYQVSAYVMAYNEITKKNIKQAGIVAIAKDKVAYNYLLLTEKAIKENFNEVFLPALKIFYFKNKNKEDDENGGKNFKTGQGTGTNSKGSGRHSKPSGKLPVSF